MVLGKHCIKSWSTTQASRALSSGEAEFYALVEGASRCMGVKALMEDLGWIVSVKLLTDSSTGKSISMRKGCGKIRHLETKYLWLQDAVFDRKLEVDKVKGIDNPSDVGTKYLMDHECEKNLVKYGVLLKVAKKVKNSLDSSP